MKKTERVRRRFLRGLKKLLADNNVWLCAAKDQRIVGCIPGLKFNVGVGLLDKNNIDEYLDKPGWTLDDEIEAWGKKR